MGDDILKQQFVLQVELNGRCYKFPCPEDAPLGELHDVLMHMKGYTIERMIANQKQEMEISKKMKEASPDAKPEPDVSDMIPDIQPV